MTWIKTKDFMPPKHEVILFKDVHGNEHYGVLCGDLSEKSRDYGCCKLCEDCGEKI